MSGTTTALDYYIVQLEVDAIIENINKMYSNILSHLSNTDWLTDIISSNTAIPIIDAIKASAITLCILFFLIDFFNKSLNLQWVTWENVMMFFIKFFVAKFLIDKSPQICECIYTGFSSMVSSAISAANSLGGSFNFISPGDYEALMLSEREANSLRDLPVIRFLDFTPSIIEVKAELMGLLISLLLIICEVIVIGRIFELVVYIFVAPLPLATFASDGLQEVGKNFLKSFVAVSIQALVLAIMFISYITITKTFSNGIFGTWDGLVRVLALTMGVLQSGAWAKRICNAM